MNARKENARLRSAFNVARDIAAGMRSHDVREALQTSPRLQSVRLLHVAKRRREARRERIAAAVYRIGAAAALPLFFIIATN
jgi:hypothetical protein